MKKTKRFTSKMIVLLFIVSILFPPAAFSQVGAVAVMALADGTTVSMTSAQLTALAAQQGITLATAPIVGATQMAIPLPAALGGGYLVGTPAAIASGLGATGIAAGVTGAGLVGATVAAGTISAGALAGTVATMGLAGTVTAGAVVLGAAVAAVAAATEEGTTTTHHH
ncbi:MAG: hypothetical protein HZB79_09925 [Deltaproteobacteria bacterium]|nr:hypothetical protein [Deltaproteobacteria bacterium]MBI5893944.1 hypothetical protein [Deltaproteobacteria bacterium]